MKFRSVVLVTLCSILLVGCGGMNLGDQTIQGGIATIHAPCQSGDCLTMGYTVHFEERPDQSAIQTVAGFLQQLTPQQMLASAVTGPERIVDSSVGGDRWEVNLSLKLENASAYENPAEIITQSVSSLERSKADIVAIHQSAPGSTANGE